MTQRQEEIIATIAIVAITAALAIELVLRVARSYVPPTL